MKKKKINILFTFIIIYSLFLGSMYLEAASLITKTAFNKMNESLTTFYNNFDENDKYLTKGPFTCSGDRIRCTGSSLDIGTLSKREYEIIGTNSYLSAKNSNNKYWTNNTNGSNAYVVNINSIEEKPQTDSYGIRGAVYVKNETTFSGTGTRIDPYVLNYVSPEESQPTGDINLIAFYVDSDGDGDYSIDEKVNELIASSNYEFDLINSNCEYVDGTVFDKNESTLKFNNENKSITIANAIKQITCSLKFKLLYGDYLASQANMKLSSNGSVYNDMIGKYVTMHSEICIGNTGICGVIPNPYNNSFFSSNPQDACSLTTTGGLSDESTGNCNVNLTYCNNSFGYTSNLQNWRIMYIEGLYDDTDLTYSNKKVDEAIIYIVSSRSPECVLNDFEIPYTSITSREVSHKYCNNSIVQGGVCNSSNSFTLRNIDFQNISKYTRGRLNLQTNTYVTLSQCNGKSSSECFNSSKSADNYNSLIYNGEYYWFNELGPDETCQYFYNTTVTRLKCKMIYMMMNDTVWSVIVDGPNSNANDWYKKTRQETAGVRPVLKLKAGIRYVGGSGLSTDPYQIIP